LNTQGIMADILKVMRTQRLGKNGAFDISKKKRAEQQVKV